MFFLNSFAEDKVGFLFSHGIGGNQYQINWYKKSGWSAWFILDGICQSFNYPEVENENQINKMKICFAQENDVATLRNSYESFLVSEKLDKIVLMGLSRGASTIINFAAQRPKSLAAIIIESPFDSIESVIEYQLTKKYIGWVPGLKSIVHYMIQKNYPVYNKFGLKPINEIKKIDPNLPILFIHSKADTLISIDSSRRLYWELKKNKYQHVYFLELESGAHANYQFGSDSNKYQATVHAFLAKYNLPHDEVFAKKGVEFLNSCNPRCFHDKK